VPLVWYTTPTDDVIHTSNDCKLQNDLDGSANVVNSNWTDGEDEDVLSSLFSVHSFTQNYASQPALHLTTVLQLVQLVYS